MKKRLIGLLSLSFLLLSACGTSKNSYNDINGDFFGSGNPVIPGEFIAANIPETVIPRTNRVEVSKAVDTNEVSYGSGTIVDNTHVGKGLLVLKNSSNNIGFYSLLTEEYILAPRFKDSWLRYTIVDTDYFGCLINIFYEDKYYTYDFFSNLLLTTEYGNYEERIVNGTAYLGIRDVHDYDYDYYEYSSTGTATKLDHLPDIIDDEEVVEKDKLEPGTIYKEGRYELKDYGLSDYSLYVASTGLISVYLNDSFQSSFYVDTTSYNFCGVVGTNLVFQRSIPVTEEYEKYNYLYNYTKYSLETLVVNLNDGEKKNKSANIVISSIYPLKKPYGSSTDNKGSYSLITYRLINDNQLLTDTVNAIVDSNFNICNDVSGAAALSFVKLNNGNFYNPTTGYIYTKDMTIITSIKDANPTYLRDIKMFLGTKDGKYGLINEEGVIQSSFDYDTIYYSDVPTANPRYVLATKSRGVYRISLQSNSISESLIGESITKIGTNLFILDRSTIISTDESLCTPYPAPFSVSNTSTFNFFNKYKVYFVTVTSGSSQSQTTRSYVGAHYASFNPTQNNNNKGKELNNGKSDGSDIDNAIEMHLNENKLHRLINNSQYSYGYFAPEHSGYYSILLPEDVSIENSDLNYQSIGYSEIYGNSYSKKYTGFFDSDINTLFRFTYPSYQSKYLYHAWIFEESGIHEQYPLMVYDYNVIHTLMKPVLESSTNKYYIAFTAPTLAKYGVSLSNSSNSITSLKVNDEEVTQYTLGAGHAVVFEVTLRNNVEENTNFKITMTTVSATEVPVVVNPERPYSLTYGNNNQPGTVNVPYGGSAYLEYRPRHAGVYGISTSLSVGSISSRTYNIYDRTGKIIDSSSSYYSSSFYIPEGGYMILGVTPYFSAVDTPANITFSATSVSSSTGMSVDNPSSFESYVSSSYDDYPHYYYYQPTNTGTYLYTVSSQSNYISYSTDGGYTFKSVNGSETIINVNSKVIFKVNGNHSSFEQSMRKILDRVDIFNPEEMNGESINISDNSYVAYSYKNETKSSQRINIEYNNSSSTSFGYAYTTTNNYLLEDGFSNYTSSYRNFGSYTLEAGQTIYFAFRNNSYSSSINPRIYLYVETY